MIIIKNIYLYLHISLLVIKICHHTLTDIQYRHHAKYGLIFFSKLIFSTFLDFLNFDIILKFV